MPEQSQIKNKLKKNENFKKIIGMLNKKTKIKANWKAKHKHKESENENKIWNKNENKS